MKEKRISHGDREGWRSNTALKRDCTQRVIAWVYSKLGNLCPAEGILLTLAMTLDGTEKK